jgi:hypothetical protein
MQYWVKNEVLKPEFGFTEEDLAGFTATCFRHATTAAGLASKFAVIRENISVVQCHAPGTQARLG